MARCISRNIVLILLRRRIIYLANTRIFFSFSRIVDYVTRVMKHETIEQFRNRVAVNKLAWMLMDV